MSNMKIFLEIPTWLGDAVMTTPAIENLIKKYPNCELTLFGSFVSTTALKEIPNVKSVIIDDSKKEGNRYLNLRRLAKSAGSFDLAFSFRKNFTTKFLFFFLDSKKKFIYQRYTKEEIHQAIRYNDFIHKSINTSLEVGNLKLYFEKEKYLKPTLGINPGATYGSAKRWYPNEFAKVAIELSSKYDIIIFGGPSETEIAKDIQIELEKSGVKNFENLAGKTSIPELISKIAGLDLFLTNDSGPMHIAAAFQVKTITMFGPTKYTETNQWANPNGFIVTKNLSCAPCMKRTCPLKHHKCMKDLKASDVLNKIGEKFGR